MAPHPDTRSQGPIRWTWRPYRHGIAAEGCVRAWLADQFGIAPEAFAIDRDGHGRPRLGAPHAGSDVSWSHSGEGLLIALGEGVQLGVDAERLRPRPRALELARRFFTPAEAEWLQARPGATREADFVRLWCAKEAILKAHGRGIAFGLHRLALAVGDAGLRLVAVDPALGQAGDWSLHEFTPAPGYAAVLAWRAAPEPAPTMAR